MLSRDEREELKALSTEIFGVSSKYQRLIQGVKEYVTAEVEEEIPGENGAEPTKQVKKVAVTDASGRKQVITREYSFEEAKDFLLKLKAQRDEMLANQKAQQEAYEEQQEQEKAQKNAQDQLSGSSL